MATVTGATPKASPKPTIATIGLVAREVDDKVRFLQATLCSLLV